MVQQIKKDLGALEDLALGIGSENQTRGNSVVPVTKISADWTFLDITAVKNIDTSKIVSAVLVANNVRSTYDWLATATIAGNDIDIIEPSSGIGRWVLRRENNLQVQTRATGVNGVNVTPHSLIPIGQVIRATFLDDNDTVGTGTDYHYSGVINVAKSSNWPDGDGYFYDPDGKQFITFFSSFATPNDGGNGGVGGGGLPGGGAITITDLDSASASSLVEGALIHTAGYTTSGDGGGNLYEIVAPATGIEDGGSFITLTTSGYQLKGLFPGNIINAEQFGVGVGAANDSDAAVAAFVFAAGRRVHFNHSVDLTSGGIAPIPPLAANIFYDSSSYNHDHQLPVGTGSTKSQVDPIYGLGSYYNDLVNGGIQYGDNGAIYPELASGLGDYTVEATFELEDVASGVHSIFDSNSHSFYIEPTLDGIAINYQPGYTVSGLTFVPGQRYYVNLTRKNGVTTIQVDDDIVGSTTLTADLSTSWVSVFGETNVLQGSLRGKGDEFRYTIGVARPLGPAPTEPFPQESNDPLWDFVVLLLKFDAPLP